jgi:hypothetical protein
MYLDNTGVLGGEWNSEIYVCEVISENGCEEGEARHKATM